jgi:Flp pilus assembly protein TadD
MVYAREGRWAEAERSFRRALEIDPNRSETHYDYAMAVLMPLGRFDEAITQVRLAVTSDPLSWFMRSALAYILIPAGRLDEAQVACNLLPEGTPDTSELQGRILLARGRINEAIAVFEAAYNRGVPPGNQVRGELGYAYARAGRREEAERFLASTPAVNPFNHAFVCAGLGDRECTIEYLTRAAAAGPFRIGRELRFAEFKSVRDDPAVKSLRARVGLPL